MKSNCTALRSSAGKFARHLGLAILALSLPLRALAADEPTFATPQAAVDALVAAAQSGDTNAVHALFGPEGQALISPDPVQAGEGLKAFVARVSEKAQVVNQSDSNATLIIGTDGWPFPVPLTQQNGKWFFDTDAGKDEILARRIGMDELGAINVCNTYVDAQHEYASVDRMGDGVFAYAQYLRSNGILHDGLFWPRQDSTDSDLSPFGPLIAQARGEGYHHTATMLSDQIAPYHGYYFKILKRQGKHAPGGKYNYVINGRMIAGFALVAWPAEWGNTGVMTFIVNQQGKVYQKDLGAKTVKLASKMTCFDPDASWIPVQ